jgi:hypothetical protein
VSETLDLARPAPEGLPLILAVDAPKKLEKLVTDPLSFRELHGSQLLPRREARRMTPRRPERRIAMYKVGVTLMRHYDRVSGRCGTPRGDSYALPDGSLQRHVIAPGQEGEHGLAAESGLSLTRFRRALGEYLRLEWVTWSQRVVEYRNKAGERCFYACRSVYTLTAKFWKAIGLDRKIARERRQASALQGHRPRIYAVVRPHTRRAARTIDQAENDARNRASAELELRRQHPGWPADRVRAEAARRQRRRQQ